MTEAANTQAVQFSLRRIRWEPAPGGKSLIGRVGTLDPWAFQIWTGGDGTRWQLLVQLPGMEDMKPEAGYPTELQAEAEKLLQEFVASLGAVFLPGACRKCGRPIARSEVSGLWWATDGVPVGDAPDCDHEPNKSKPRVSTAD